jgi:hypothetical protein
MLVTTIALATVITALLIVFSGDDSRPFFSNWTINAAAGAALSMALVASFRRGQAGCTARPFLHLRPAGDMVCRRTPVDVI